VLTGSLVRTLRGHSNPISGVAAYDVSNARGGAIIVSASRENANMRVWKFSTGECLRFFKGHTMDINAVEIFPSPNPDKDDVIIVSGSKDATVRTWLFAEEKALKVIEPGPKLKVKAMGVYPCGRDSVIVTGCDDGSLSAWTGRRSDHQGDTGSLWRVEKAHKHHVFVIAIYAPTVLTGEEIVPFGQHRGDISHWPEHLHKPLVFSASRRGTIRVTSVLDGSQITTPIPAHKAVITSLAVFSGTRLISTGRVKGIDPFLVSGSEDNSAKVWSLVDFTCIYTLEGHAFDVTTVAVYMPAVDWDSMQKGVLSRPGSREGSRGGSFSMASVSGKYDPVIVTGSIDETVRLWSFATGELLKELNDAHCHITCVAAITIPQHPSNFFNGPVVLAGDGNGNIHVWSLHPPYALLKTVKAHVDEVRSVFVYDSEGMPAVLVSGSLDCTVKVWNLGRMKVTKTMEGHTAEITVVRVFTLGGSDLALVSSSTDATVRVVYDFMEAAPQYDVVKQHFQFDMNGTNSHVTINSNSAFPRIYELSRREGPEAFFGTYSSLFADALQNNRADFLEEFLPQSKAGLLKSNKDSSLAGGANGGGGGGGLLRQALLKADKAAVHTIVDCWCAFYNSDLSKDLVAAELIHDAELARISMPDMLLLAELAPSEFARLICSIKLIQVAGNAIPPLSYYLHEKDGSTLLAMTAPPKPTKNSLIGKEGKIAAAKSAVEVKKLSVCARFSNVLSSFMPRNGDTMVDVLTRAKVADENTVTSGAFGDEKLYLYLPITNAVHMDMLYAYTHTCETLDSVEIFNSEVGQLVLQYAWSRMGLKVHLFKMFTYFTYMIIVTVSVLTFRHNKDDSNTGFVSVILIVLQLVADLYFIKEEGLQLAINPFEYLSDIWNAMDFTVIVTNALANVLRLVYYEDTPATQVFLAISSIVGYFNLLYYLRAFEATGPLVSMVLKIANDITYLIIIVMIVTVGFSLAFYVVSSDDSQLPFGTMQSSLINSYVFMLGGYDPSAFEDVQLRKFAVFLSAIYMLIVNILILNLLIALMGDSYGAVKEKGLAQWKLEQAQIITEMQGTMREKDRACTDLVRAMMCYICCFILVQMSLCWKMQIDRLLFSLSPSQFPFFLPHFYLSGRCIF
jgi:WD40 repeat protein